MNLTLLHILYGVLGAVCPGLLAYGLGRWWCAATTSAALDVPQPCWEPVAAGAFAAAVGWIMVWTWWRWKAQQVATATPTL